MHDLRTNARKTEQWPLQFESTYRHESIQKIHYRHKLRP